MDSRLWDDVKTGDLILFSDRYWITSNITRLVTHSRWSHLGVLVVITRPSDPRTAAATKHREIYVWEAGNGVWPLQNWLLSLDQPSVKYAGIRMVELAEKLHYFSWRGNLVEILSLRNHRLHSLVLPPNMMDPILVQEMERAWLHGVLFPLMQYLGDIDFRHDLLTFCRAAWRTHWPKFRHGLIEQLPGNPSSQNEGGQSHLPSSPRPRSRLPHPAPPASILPSINLDAAKRTLREYLDQHGERLFCSEAIVLLYQVVGIVPTVEEIDPRRFVPRDFAPRHENKDKAMGKVTTFLPPRLPLQNGWNLVPLMSFRLA